MKLREAFAIMSDDEYAAAVHELLFRNGFWPFCVEFTKADDHDRKATRSILPKTSAAGTSPAAAGQE